MSVFLHFLAEFRIGILPFSIILAVILFIACRKKHQKVVSLFFLLPIFGILNLIYAGEWNTNYVLKNGEEGTGRIVQITPTNNYTNHIQMYNYQGVIETKTGKSVRVFFENNSEIISNARGFIPSIGTNFKVKYMKEDADNFVILGEKNPFNPDDCMKNLELIGSAKATYQADKSNTQAKHALRQALKKYISQPCDSNSARGFQLFLDQL